MQDRTLRSHLVTYTYLVFARDLDQRIFGTWTEGGETNQRAANWFNFASWATLTVGGNIRHDRGPQRLKDLPGWFARLIEPTTITLRSSREEFVGRALTFGESLPFSTSTLPYLALINTMATCPDRPFCLPHSLRSQLKLLFHSDRQEESIITDDHLDLIERSFDTFRLAHRAASITDENASSRPLWAALILYANVLLATVEQLLVDGVVNDVVEFLPNSALGSTGRRLAVSEEQTWTLHKKLADGLVKAWAHFMTRHVLVLDLRSERLSVGGTIEDSERRVLSVLEDLKAVEGSIPAAHPDAHLFRDRLDSLGRMIGVLGHSALVGQVGASDWRSFDDRVRWAIGLMNGLQFDDRMLRPTYSDTEGTNLRNALFDQLDGANLSDRAGVRRFDQPIMRGTRQKEQRRLPVPGWLGPQPGSTLDEVFVGTT